MKKRKKKATRISVKMRMTPEEEYERHDRHDEDFVAMSEKVLFDTTQKLVEGIFSSLGSSIMANIRDPEQIKKRKAELEKATKDEDEAGSSDTTDGTTDGTTDTVDVTSPGTEEEDRFTVNPNKIGEYIDNETGKPVGNWPGAKNGAAPPIWGGNQEDNPYKDWYQDEDGDWVNTPRATPGTTSTGGDSTGPPPAGGAGAPAGGGTQEPPQVDEPMTTTPLGQQKKIESFDMSVVDSDYLQENIKKQFSDFLREKNIELGLQGMLGEPVLTNPKKKKQEESAMLMMMPMMYKMQNESRRVLDESINKEDS